MRKPKKRTKNRPNPQNRKSQRPPSPFPSLRSDSFEQVCWNVCVFLWQPHQPVQEKKKPSANAAVVDHRSVDDLLTFINGQKMEEERLATKSKAQKRARQKQKKVRVTWGHSCTCAIADRGYLSRAHTSPQRQGKRRPILEREIPFWSCDNMESMSSVALIGCYFNTRT